MPVQDWLQERFEGTRTEFWKLFDKWLARLAWVIVLGLIGAAIAWWRNRAQDTVTLATWLAVILAGVFASSVAVSALYVLDRYRRRRQPKVDPTSRVEMRVGGLFVRVSRSLLVDRYLDSDWMVSNWERITKPLCPGCKGEVMRQVGYGEWELVGRCVCGANIAENGRPLRMDLSEFKKYVFEQLQRRYRADLPLTEGTQLTKSSEEQEEAATTS